MGDNAVISLTTGLREDEKVWWHDGCRQSGVKAAHTDVPRQGGGAPRRAEPAQVILR